MVISLAFILLVGSLGMGLYADWARKLLALSIYSSLSMTTMANPLSAVRIILDLSLLAPLWHVVLPC